MDIRHMIHSGSRPSSFLLIRSGDRKAVQSWARHPNYKQHGYIIWINMYMYTADESWNIKFLCMLKLVGSIWFRKWPFLRYSSLINKLSPRIKTVFRIWTIWNQLIVRDLAPQSIWVQTKQLACGDYLFSSSMWQVNIFPDKSYILYE